MATKINYEQNSEVNFEEIKEGEIFNYREHLFIRTKDSFEYEDVILNTVCLDNGNFVHFNKNDKVRKIDVEINVKFI